jgi:ABC-type dipeptide/oligopeptide/nickel transport system permease subunit
MRGFLPFVGHRIFRALIALWLVSTVVFVVMRLSGDPVPLLLPPDAPTSEILRVRRDLGLDRPLPVQYGVFLGNILRGDFGRSIHFREPAATVVRGYLGATLELGLTAFVLAAVAAVPIGLLSAMKRNTLLDHAAMGVALIGQSAPTFFLGILFILLLALKADLFPTSGRGDWRNLVLPALTLGAFTMASIARLTRSAVLEVLGADYIRTARAKGVSEIWVVAKHTLKNAAIPIVTITGLQFGTLLGGAVVTETVFSWPGIGRLAVQSIYNRDYPVVQCTVFARPRVGGRRVPWLTMAGAGFVLLVAAVAVAAPWLAPADPVRQSLRGRLSPPTLEGIDGHAHLLGTDHLGRDVLSRVIYGSRVSLVVGVCAVLIGGLLGSALGILAGWSSGRVDAIIMTVADAQLAFPFILLAIGIIAVLGPSFPTLIVVIGLSGWVSYARILRSQVLSLRSREFVEAIQALGGSVLRIVLRHVVPNVLSSIVVVATLELARSIVLEATLSFLGLGIQPPTPSWGGMIQEGRDYLDTAWWIATFPGIVLMLTSVVVSRTGDGLRDLLDPTLRGE